MKQLKDLTKKEYESLDKAGMLYVFYPEATGNYKNDCLTFYSNDNDYLDTAPSNDADPDSRC